MYLTKFVYDATASRARSDVKGVVHRIPIIIISLEFEMLAMYLTTG